VNPPLPAAATVRARHWPDNFPICGDGFFIGYVGNILIAALAPGNNGDGYQALLTELPKTFALVEPDDNLIAFYRGTSSEWWKQQSLVDRARHIKALGAMIEPHRRTLRTSFCMGVYYPSDLLQRVALRTWITLIRSRAQNHVVDNDAAAWAALERGYAHPSVSFADARAACHVILSRFTPRLAA
jgi:hypothetical protein